MSFFQQNKATLAAELALPSYAGKTTAEIAEMLCSSQVIANPEPQPQIPASDAYRAQQLKQNTPATLLATFSDVALLDLLDAVAAADLARIRTWLQIAVARSKVDQTFADQATALLDDPLTMPDPTWPATIKTTPRLFELFPEAEIKGYAISHADIVAAKEAV